ncbi:multidrug MFS transporter [Terribacillus saccharophilus]|uniref:sugar transferase n=1 Tax=Terribacillus saccharophilus TaxID=361277 RepID=UPI000BA62931|nr:sugar transferase [Terribacillus saccharophilus]PAF37228.1 multidrug MFS transporter [Terribacillus saccharophilus]
MAESKQIYKAIDAKDVIKSDNKYYLFTKRTMDIVLSSFGIILLLPIFILIALLIKIEDKRGSIFFCQVRVGKDGQTFQMYKFRSMVSNAEDLLEKLVKQNEASGPLFKMKEDPRVTRIGKILRKTSLDELPQLFNVLKGEMSLVGPRPALPREVDTYSLFERERLKVVPGLTCYWQVKGRSDLTFEQQVLLDLKYINDRNMFLDIKLVLKTVIVLFKSKGAY